MAKEITLEELGASNERNSHTTKPVIKTEEAVKSESKVVQSNNIKSARPISTSDLGKNLAAQHPEAQKKNIEEDAPLVANAFASMNKTLEEKKKYIDEVVVPIVHENAREIAMENEIGKAEDDEEQNTSEAITDDDIFADLDDEEDVSNSKKNDGAIYTIPEEKNYTINSETESNNKKSSVKVVEKEPSTNDNSELDNLLESLGLDDEKENIDDEETTEELRERFKESMESIKITRDPIDLSKFRISKNPISTTAALNTMTNPTKKRCDWPLMHTGRNMTFEECSGPELDALKKTINNSNGVNGVIASLRFVYNHNIDANKKSFEAWCKSIRTEDIESLYFGMYKACYADANLVARADVDEKKGCKKTSLINTPINDMVKYKDDKAKAKFDELMAMDTTNPNNRIKSNIMVVSDDLAISYSDPTLYSTFIQYASLKSDVTEKFSDQLNTMAYIDGFFKIDRTNNELVPISIKEYPNSINKTIMSKLKAYIDILKGLTNDQYNIMVGKLDNVIGEPEVSYIYPESVCPECQNTIPEEPIESMLNLLFTRAQLVQVKSL